METIDDVRRQEGNPRHGDVGGPPRSVDRFFGELSVPKFIALGFLVLAVILIGLGVVTLVFPITVVGVVSLTVAAVIYLRAKSRPIV